jgi:tetratricopeptide (TPR) repeat protein
VLQYEYERALSDLDRAVELDPTFAWSHYERGVALNELGRPREAVESFSRAIEMEPLNAKPFEHRGWTHALLGDHRRALADFDRAIDLAPAGDPSLPSLYEWRARSQEKLDRDGPSTRADGRGLGRLEGANGP